MPLVTVATTAIPTVTSSSSSTTTSSFSSQGGLTRHSTILLTVLLLLFFFVILATFCTVYICRATAYLNWHRTHMQKEQAARVQKTTCAADVARKRAEALSKEVRFGSSCSCPGEPSAATCCCGVQQKNLK